jgi:hypothetical protein
VTLGRSKHFGQLERLRHADILAFIERKEEVGAARQRVQSAFELVLLGPEVTNRSRCYRSSLFVLKMDTVGADITMTVTRGSKGYA